MHVEISEKSIFASHTLVEHLLRGVLGVGALALAIEVADQPLLSLLLGVAMLVAFKGCPICWTIGLFETAYRALKPNGAHRK